MKRVRALIFIKDREMGLLSVAEGRAKSLIPVFGGNRIIDTYLHPFLHAGLERVMVLTGDERADIKDYFLYRYSSSSVEIENRQEVLDVLARALRLRHGERALILQAEGLLLLDWKHLLRFLNDLPENNYHIRTQKKETIGFFVVEGRVLGDRVGKASERVPEGTVIDDAWERVKKLLESGCKPVEYRATLFPLRTVTEYYKSHFAILRKLEEFIGFEQLHPVEEVDEKSLCSVTASGSVKDSYISHSCLVEGIVERSILFPHAKVGKNAMVVNSLVMDHNSIGSGALLQNTILCDNNELFSRMTPNVGESARIGEDDKSGANTLFPALISGGVTLIGRNVEIPKGLAVSRNCYIASDVGKAAFRGKEKIRPGDTILTAEG